MFLYPIGRDDAEIRRHAWISYAIIALNILFFIASLAVLSRDAAPLESKWQEIVEHLSAHPYLTPSDELKPMLTPEDLTYLGQAREEWFRNRGGWESAAREGERRNKRVLDQLTGELVASLQQTPFHRYGYKPSDGSFSTMITSMFLHGDFMHLLGNLLFFFATAPFIEDVFGRPIFAVLYFTGGMAATLTHAAHNAGSDIPLIGASGAIAAVMGAYLIRFTRSKIEFMWIPIIILPRIHARFYIPAFVVLPLWFGMQTWFATQESLLSGVAFWAHVGGFAYGMGFALLLRVGDVEKRFIDPAIEGQIMWKQDPRLLRAAEARANEDFAKAQREIANVLRSDPGNLDAHRAGFEMAMEMRNGEQFGRFATSLLDALIRTRELDLAAEHISEVTALHEYQQHVPERFFLRAAQLLEKQGDRRGAIDLYTALTRIHPGGAAAFRALVQIGRLQRLAGDLNAARISLRNAQTHHACTPEDRTLVGQQLAELPPEPMPWD